MTGDSSGTDATRSASLEGDSQSLHIFICYRREDTAAYAGRLGDALVERFGRNSVFMDVDTIEAGVDFNDEIDRAIGHCDALIALIGPRWLEAASARGRRLDDPQDFVRVEIGHALDRNIRVIPTLVGGAQMPDAGDLPGDIAKLAKRNAVELTDKRFRTDLQSLVEPLERIAQQKRDRALATVPNTAPLPIGRDELQKIAPQQPHAPPALPVTGHPPTIPAAAKRIPNPALRGRKMLPLVALLVLVALVIAGGSVLALSRRGTNNSAASKPTNLLALPASYAGIWRGTAHEISPSADFAIIMTFQTGNIGTKIGTINRPTASCQQELTLDKATSQSITMTETGYCTLPGTKVVASLSGGTMDWKEFQTDPSSGNPIATATLTQASSGSIRGTSDLLAVPDGYLGTWKGTGHEISPSADFAITLTLQAGKIGTKVGTSDRPTASCQQDLTLDKATSQSITMTENGYCTLPGTKIVASLNGSSIDWKEFQGDPSSGNPVATATLTKTA